MEGSGIISGVIRFICHIPLGYYGVVGFNHYELIRDHAPEILTAPLSYNIFAVQALAGIGGMLAFIYNFFAWIPSIWAEGMYLVMFGIGDCVVLVMIGISMCMQATYYPLTVGSCMDIKPWTDHTEPPSDPKLLFFDRLGRTNGTNPVWGRETCNSFLGVWYVGLVMFLLYAISAASNLSLGTGCFGIHRLRESCASRKASRRRQRSRRIFSWPRIFQKRQGVAPHEESVELKRPAENKSRKMRWGYPRVHLEWVRSNHQADPSDSTTVADNNGRWSWSDTLHSPGQSSPTASHNGSGTLALSPQSTWKSDESQLR